MNPIMSRAAIEELRRKQLSGGALFGARLAGIEKSLGIKQINPSELRVFVNHTFGMGSYERALAHLQANNNFPKGSIGLNRGQMVQLIEWLEQKRQKTL